jgi:hypothetical protein
MHLKCKILGKRKMYPRAFKAPWYASKSAAHRAEKHQVHNGVTRPNPKPTAIWTEDELPRKKARFTLKETRERPKRLQLILLDPDVPSLSLAGSETQHRHSHPK